ncbi:MULTISPECIES: hypothetical protein [Enterobacter cloacae complex]|uniref:hypothetical protein n=1 Tax=Enterobacter cloacae complex TaxID=354276 RepID=UPI00207681FD|nr:MULTISPECIES: hypothetical protein [Enterobacter cloacae complex]MCM7451683.1 hypothetical protein [Enterobacter cloacae]MDD7870874.1 hypothetical protein [Enterobacter cloacae complex sp. 2022EL-00981]MEB7645880.1 hypothetical protein [Enterobacter hormaechei]
MKLKFIEWFTKNNNGRSPAMEDDRSFVYEMTQHMFEAYQAGVAEGEARCAAMAAENAALKHAMAVTLEHVSVTDTGQAGVAAMIINDALHHSGTPATDAFLAEVRTQESKRVYESILDNPAVTDMESLVDWLEQNANDSVAFAAQLRKGVQS